MEPFQETSRNEQRLTFTIDTEDPIPVEIFCSSLLAFQREYNSTTQNTSRLLVKEIRKGSFEFDLIAIAGLTGTALLPLIANVNSIGDFVNHFRDLVSWLSGNGKPPKEKSYTADELRNLKEIFQPIIIAADPSGSIRVVTEGLPELEIDKQTAVAVVSRIGVTQSATPAVSPYLIPERNQAKVLFYWYQTRFDSKQINTGNQGVVEALDSKPRKVIFADDSSDTKHQMTTTNQQFGRDWQEVGYIVDLELVVVGERIVAYKILRNYPEDTIYDLEES